VANAEAQIKKANDLAEKLAAMTKDLNDARRNWRLPSQRIQTGAGRGLANRLKSCSCRGGIHGREADLERQLKKVQNELAKLTQPEYHAHRCGRS